MVKASAYNAEDQCLIPGWGRSPGEENGNPLQFSCLENPKGGGRLQSMGHKESDMTERLHFTFHFYLDQALYKPSLMVSACSITSVKSNSL